MVSFLQHCLAGPIFDFFKKQLDKIESERTEYKLRCISSDDKLELLKKQLESNEKHKADYLKRYEDAVSDKKRIAEDYSIHVANLKSKCSTLEERCLSLSKSLELTKGESADWKVKYDRRFLEQKAEEERFKADIAALEARSTAAEGRLVAVREQANSAKEEAAEWRRKYEFTLAEAKGARDRAAEALEHSNKKARERADALRAELSGKLMEKDEGIRKLHAKIDHTELQASSLISRLEAAESRVKSHEFENLALKEEINRLTDMLDSIKSRAQSHEKELKMLEQQKNHLQEKYLSECKNFDGAEKRREDAEREAKKAIELSDIARAEAAAAHKEKNDSHRLAMERLTLIERAQRQVESLEREKSKLTEEVARLRSSELEATSKADLLERRLEERDKELEELLSRSNEQRSSTVHVLESLLATERAALAEANNRAEALSIQLQATQRKLDALQQEQTTLDSKLRTAQGKRSRTDYLPVTESVHDMDTDGEILRSQKRSKSTTSPLNQKQTEDGGSIYRGADDDNNNNNNQSQGNQETGSEDYTKFTVLKLKQELTKHGFGAELLQLKNPNKKDILALYTKHVPKK